MSGTYPDTLFGRRALAHTFQAFAPVPLVPPQAPQPPRRTNFDPVVLRGRPARAHEFQSFATAPGIKTTILAGYGDPGAATLVLSIEPGARSVFLWSTSIITSYSGVEQRESTHATPQRRFEGTAFLLDTGSRDTRGALMRAAAQGSTFLLALPFEELITSVDSSARTIFVTATAMSDWLVATQRCVVVSVDGTVTPVVIQSFTSTSILLDVALGTAGRAGARIMPVVQVLFDPDQGFARYPVAVDTWSVRARANVFGWAGVDNMGLGASLTTYSVGTAIPLTDVTEADLLIWDRGNDIDATADEALHTLGEIVDMGALPFAIGGAHAPGWTRALRYRSTSQADWQWFKAFVHLLRGPQGAFLLPTDRADLTYVATVGGAIKVASSSVAGAGDYASWWESAAHRRLMVTLDNGARQYVTVTVAPVNNGDGTLTLTLDAVVVGTVVKLSLLEQVRLEEDAVSVTWDGATFSVALTVRSVLETIAVDPPAGFMFDTVITIGPVTPPVGTFPNFELLNLALGKTTLIYVTAQNLIGTPISPRLTGISASGGNVDGMIVCFVAPDASMLVLTENTQSSASNRFAQPAALSSPGAGGSRMLRYSSTASRWVSIL
jgi:hypothetical protein